MTSLILAAVVLLAPSARAQVPAIGKAVDVPAVFHGSPEPGSTRKAGHYRVTAGTVAGHPAHRVEWKEGRQAYWAEIVDLPDTTTWQAARAVCDAIPASGTWQLPSNDEMGLLQASGLTGKIWFWHSVPDEQIEPVAAGEVHCINRAY